MTLFFFDRKENDVNKVNIVPIKKKLHKLDKAKLVAFILLKLLCIVNLSLSVRLPFDWLIIAIEDSIVFCRT